MILNQSDSKLNLNKKEPVIIDPPPQKREGLTPMTDLAEQFNLETVITTNKKTVVPQNGLQYSGLPNRHTYPGNLINNCIFPKDYLPQYIGHFFIEQKDLKKDIFDIFYIDKDMNIINVPIDLTDNVTFKAEAVNKNRDLRGLLLEKLIPLGFQFDSNKLFIVFIKGNEELYNKRTKDKKIEY